MNILFTYTNPINKNCGGVQRMTFLIATHFIELGHNLYFLSVNGKGNQLNQFVLPNANYIVCSHNIKYIRTLINDLSINVIINQAGIDTSMCSLLSEVRKQTQIRVVTCIHNSIFGGVLNFGITHQNQLKKFHLSWASKIFDIGFVKNLLIRFYIRKYKNHYLSVLNNSDRVVLLSQSMKREYERIVATDVSNKVTIIPNFIQPPQLSSLPKENLVIYVGRIDRLYKRTDLAIKIWDKLYHSHPDWKLQIIGDGKDLEYINNLTASLGTRNVSFEGIQDPKVYYQKARILMLTSCSESFGLVLAEAMSYGVVPVAFDAFENIHDIIENESDGILIEPFNLGKYAEKMSDLMRDQHQIESMSLKAKRKASKFYEKKVYLQWEELLCQK